MGLQDESLFVCGSTDAETEFAAACVNPLTCYVEHNCVQSEVIAFSEGVLHLAMISLVQVVHAVYNVLFYAIL